MKKRILSLTLAAAMALSLGVGAMADGNVDKYSGDSFTKDSGSTSYATTSDDGTTQFDVTDTETIYNRSSWTTVYAVEVSWTMTPGSYSRTDTYQWNPETLKYDAADPTAGTPTVGTGTAAITVTNRSNAAVSYAVSYASATALSQTVSTESASGTAVGALDAADVSEDGTPASYTVAGKATTASYTGTLSYTDAYQTALAAAESSSNTTMGTYTVTIGKPYAVLDMSDMLVTYSGPEAVAPGTDTDFEATFTLSADNKYFSGGGTHNAGDTIYTPYITVNGTVLDSSNYTWAASNSDKTGTLTIPAAQITGDIMIQFTVAEVPAAAPSVVHYSVGEETAWPYSGNTEFSGTGSAEAGKDYVTTITISDSIEEDYTFYGDACLTITVNDDDLEEDVGYTLNVTDAYTCTVTIYGAYVTGPINISIHI